MKTRLERSTYRPADIDELIEIVENYVDGAEQRAIDGLQYNEKYWGLVDKEAAKLCERLTYRLLLNPDYFEPLITFEPKEASELHLEEADKTFKIKSIINELVMEAVNDNENPCWQGTVYSDCREALTNLAEFFQEKIDEINELLSKPYPK